MKIKTSCKKCGKRAKRIAEELGYPGLCLRHLRLEIGEVKKT